MPWTSYGRCSIRKPVLINDVMKRGYYQWNHYLDHGPPGVLFVFQTSLTTNSNDARIICSGGHETIEGVGGDSLRSHNSQFQSPKNNRALIQYLRRL